MSNQMITTEFRQKCLEKIQALHSKLGTPETPENIEMKCFERSKMKYEEYLKIIQSVLYRSKYHSAPAAGNPSQGGPVIAASTSKSNVNTADSLYALQNLTGHAGHSGAPQNNNMRLNQTAYGNQIRPRSLIQGTVSRSEDGFCSSNSPSSQQLVASKIPMNVVISTVNIANAANIRMANSPLTMKNEVCINQSNGPQSLMAPPYHADSYNLSLMNSHQNVSKFIPGKPVQYNTIVGSQYQSPKDQFKTLHPSAIVSTINNPHHNGSAVQSTSNVTSNPRSQTIVSDLESKKVKEEINRLKERFLQKLSIILESPKSCSEEEIKIWTALKNLLENPDSISKPLSMRNVLKIEQHLLKADQHLMNKLSNKLPTCQSGESFHKGAPIGPHNNLNPNRNENMKHGANYEKSLSKTSARLLPNNSGDNSNITTGMSSLSSLDIAFDDVCDHLQKTEKTVFHKVQLKLIEYMKSKQSLYQHFLPKRVYDDMENGNLAEENLSKRAKLEPIFDETEFNLGETQTNENPDALLVSDIRNSFSDGGLLRLDLNIGSANVNFHNIKEEFQILQPEFQVTKLDDQKYSKDWFSYDSNWEGSQFFSVLYENKNLPSCVPPITLRLPVDYEDSGYTDWNLNLGLYPAQLDQFLSEVANLLNINFTDAHRNYQWAGIPILYVVSLYKRSIVLAYSNWSADRK